MAVDSLQESLLQLYDNPSASKVTMDGVNVAYNALSIDVLTPGLNPKLEQKAILQQDYLFR